MFSQTFKLTFAGAFLLYVSLMGFYYLYLKLIKGKLKAKKDLEKAEILVSFINEKYPIKEAERNNKIREARERAIINSKLNFPALEKAINKKINEVNKNDQKTELFEQEIREKIRTRTTKTRRFPRRN